MVQLLENVDGNEVERIEKVERVEWGAVSGVVIVGLEGVNEVFRCWIEIVVTVAVVIDMVRLMFLFYYDLAGLIVAFLRFIVIMDS